MSFTNEAVSIGTTRAKRIPNLGKWNLPNKITYSRILLTTIIGVLGLWNHATLLIFPLLIVGGITDKLDGRLARERGEVTYFGAVIDRGADKYYVFVVASLMWQSFKDAHALLPNSLMLWTFGELKFLIAIEVALVAFAIIGARMNWPIESSSGGKWKMVTECVFSPWWALFFYILVPLLDLTLNSKIFLVPMVILLTVSNILAIVSSYGYAKAYAPLIAASIKKIGK